MSAASPDPRLSQVQTLWTVVCRAHGAGTVNSVKAAQEEMLARYITVVRRYLLGALRDADAADELTQEFALRFVRGDLKGVDRQRGRFRDYLKGTLFHLIGDFYRRKKKAPAPLLDEQAPSIDAEDASQDDQQFLQSWRAELLQRAWHLLEQLQETTGQPYFRVLQLRASQPELRSGEMAERMSAASGQAVNAAWVRQNLHRAREKFADYLLEEVRQTLDQPTLENLEEELILLELHGYCQPALEALRTAPH